ncbi:MAG: hypothetical protein HKM24_00290 [Gammaproteobacteria bacterium]|nr:hypothetical protein [Gammaproteobacteria bacterium]
MVDFTISDALIIPIAFILTNWPTTMFCSDVGSEIAEGHCFRLDDYKCLVGIPIGCTLVNLIILHLFLMKPVYHIGPWWLFLIGAIPIFLVATLAIIGYVKKSRKDRDDHPQTEH